MNPMVETMSIIHCQWASERPFSKSMRHLSIPKLLRSQFDHFRISLYIKSFEWPIFGVAWTISPLEGFLHPWKFGSSQTNASSPSTKHNRVPNWTCSRHVPVLNSLCNSWTEMNGRNWALDLFCLEHLHDTVQWMALALLKITFQKLANFVYPIPSLARSHMQMIQIVQVMILHMPSKPACQ